MVGEWNFTINREDPARVLDEHWYMTPYYVDRKMYRTTPRYHLTGVNIEADNYVRGPLEDWTAGALRLNGRDEYLLIEDATLEEPFRVQAGTAKKGGWATVTMPEALVPGEPAQIEVKLAEPHEGQKVAVHLHWLKEQAWGGFNAWGGMPKDAASTGPHTFTFTPEDTPDLATFQALIFLSPDGDWDNRAVAAKVRLPKGEEGADVGAQTVELGGEESAERWLTFAGAELKNPEIYESNFLIEAYFQAPSGASGVLVQKMGERAGYGITVGDDGRARFTLRGDGDGASVKSGTVLADGDWHHLLVEADREAKLLVLYVDGEKNAEGPGIGQELSLSNEADLYVGGTPEGHNLAGTIDFLRICQGTLADARTSIDELYAWQFDGPQFRDFAGNEPQGKRDAGAIELVRR
jgi:hypothetical protein